MREFVIDLTTATSYNGFVAAFNTGFCSHCQSRWHGNNWNAFHDYLSWPKEEHYRLTFLGWDVSKSLTSDQRDALLQIFADNPHVEVMLSG